MCRCRIGGPRRPVPRAFLPTLGRRRVGTGWRWASGTRMCIRALSREALRVGTIGLGRGAPRSIATPRCRFCERWLSERQSRASDRFLRLGPPILMKARFGLGLAQAYDGADQPDEAISALGERTPLPPGGPCPGFSFRVASMPCAGMQPDARPRGLAWKSWDLRSNVQCAASPQVLPAACCRHTCPSLVGSQSLSHSSCALLLEYIIASDLFHQRL